MERKYLISKTVCPGGCCSKMLIEQASFRSRTYSVKCLIVHIFALTVAVFSAVLTAVMHFSMIFLCFVKKASRRHDSLVYNHNILLCVRACLYSKDVLHNWGHGSCSSNKVDVLSIYHFVVCCSV